MKVDMSAAAVTARLKLTSQLRRLCLSLGKAKPVEAGAKAAGKPESSQSDSSRSDSSK